MAEIRKKEETKSFSEEASNLWLITFAPSIWAMHFVVSYATAAVICAKFSQTAETILLLRAGLGGLTVLALAGIAYIGWRSWGQWDFLDDYDFKHDKAVAEHRHEFLGHASFLLSVMSFIGVIYVAMPAVFLETCQ